jgi:dipeptide/tripeptide permease
MSQVINVKKTTDEAVAQNTRRGWQLLGTYVLIQLALILLKAHGLTRVAAWSWAKVTAITWGPWLMAVAISLLVVIARLGSKLRGK